MNWRISVIGTAGCGKTTLSRELSQRLDIPHVELDAFNWGPNWTFVPNATFLERVDAALEQENWVMDGNYIRVRFEIWSRATHIVWLDYPRLAGYAAGNNPVDTAHSEAKKELWAGNRETVQKTFLSKDSIIRFAWKSYPRQKEDYEQLLSLSLFGDTENRQIKESSRNESLAGRFDGMLRANAVMEEWH